VGSKSRLREKLECEMAMTPVYSIRKAPETPLVSVVPVRAPLGL
jgi:hypothetical protein